MGRGGKDQRTATADAEFRQRIDAAKDRHNLSDVIRRHTTLRRRGQRELVGICPFHAEKSPSLEVNDNKGAFYCHGCGMAGDHFTILTRLDGMTFRQAYETLTGDAFPVVAEEDRAKRKAEDEAAAALRIADARAVWKSAVPAAGTLAEVYARSRAIRVPLPGTVRFAMTPRWRDHETGECDVDRPAVICALQNAAGAVVGVQRIFLSPDGRDKMFPKGSGKKSKLSLGVIVGSALRLGPIAEKIIACEGPEDGWSLFQEMPGRSVWVACGTALLSRMEFPPEVQDVTLAGDNNAAGRAAVAAAAEAYSRQSLTARSMYPDPRFKDWNDELRGIAA
jgi:DNA primase